MGAGFATNTVTVNGQATYRKGEYFRKEVTVANSSTPVWQSITVSAAGQTNIVGNVLVPRANESFWHDSDGNLLSDSLWTNTWNSENRVVGVESAVNVPGQARMREEWTHLPDGRWIQRIVSTNSGGVYYPAYTNRFVWDRQVLLAILDHTNGVVASFMRGSDLSGSIQGAGGVGGVLAVNFGLSTFNTQPSTPFPPSTHCVSYDGNGNVVALHNAADGAESAAYEYGPFSEPIRVTGPVASLMPLRFSTMYEDNVTGDRKYLFRDYTPSTCQWKSRDPIGEAGGLNIYGVVGCNLLSKVDALGLDDSGIVYNAFRRIRQNFAESRAADSTGYKIALRRLMRVVPLITVRIGDLPPGASGAYEPFFDRLTLPANAGDGTIVHEMVHAWNDNDPSGITSDREDEGMAYGLEQAFDLAVHSMTIAERTLSLADPVCRGSFLRKVWTNYWERRARPESYPGGRLNDRRETNFKLNAQDFLRLESKLGFKISCDKFAGVLNDILSSRGCSCRFTCDASDPDPTHITPGVVIHQVFRDL
jgi:RHS repeat-associated protein